MNLTSRDLGSGQVAEVRGNRQMFDHGRSRQTRRLLSGIAPQWAPDGHTHAHAHNRTLRYTRGGYNAHEGSDGTHEDIKTHMKAHTVHANANKPYMNNECVHTSTENVQGFPLGTHERTHTTTTKNAHDRLITDKHEHHNAHKHLTDIHTPT